MECFECGGPASHDHHVVPKSLGGTKTVPLCLGCHKKIHDPQSILSLRKLLPEFRVPNKVTLEMRKQVMRRKGKCSSREVAKLVGVSFVTVLRIWDGRSGIHRIHKKLSATL